MKQLGALYAPSEKGGMDGNLHPGRFDKTPFAAVSGKKPASLVVDVENDMESWRSLLTDTTPGFQDMYLGPPVLPSLSQNSEADDEEEIRIRYGSRADIMVRQSSNAVSIPYAVDCLPRVHQIADACTDAGEIPSVQALNTSLKKDFVHLPNPLHEHGRATLVSVTTSLQQSESPDLDEEDRENWPSSFMSPTSLLSLGSLPSTSLGLEQYTPASSDLVPDDPSLLCALHSTGPPRAEMTHTARMTTRIPSRPSSSSSLSSPILPKTNKEIAQVESSTEVLPGEPFVVTDAFEDKRVSFMTTEQRYIITIHLPGFALDGITIATKGCYRRTLHIIASRCDSDMHDFFERRITFGAKAIMTSIRARFDGQHLIIEIPRESMHLLTE